jgi:hypothetical protein
MINPNHRASLLLTIIHLELRILFASSIDTAPKGYHLYVHILRTSFNRTLLAIY